MTDAPNDKQQLIPALQAVSPAVGKVGTVLVDSGYYSAEAVTSVQAEGGPEVLAAMKRERHGRSVEQLEKREDPPHPGKDAPPAELMAWKLATAAGKKLYGLRKQTVEPVFGIIKEALGFRRFLLRGMEKVNLEWTLVRLAYNLKRLYHMDAKLQAA